MLPGSRRRSGRSESAAWSSWAARTPGPAAPRRSCPKFYAYGDMSARVQSPVVGSGERGEGRLAVAALAAGHDPVGDVTDDHDQEGHGQHDRAERAQRWPAVAAVLLRVDVDRHRRVPGAGGQQVDDHEVVDDA